MKFWFKIYKDNHIVRDTTVEDTSDETRTHKVFHALEKACHDLDLAVPIWLPSNVAEFQKRRKTRFTKDSFVDEIGFDWFEIEVLKEDGDSD